MKKRYKIISILFVFLALTFSAVACSEHSHTYSSDYTFDDEYHWKSATCEHAEEFIDKGAHEYDAGTLQSDGSVSYACLTCGHTYSHEHTFSSEWSYDNNYHWKAVTCECEGNLVSKTSHQLGNVQKGNDGKWSLTCSGCGYKDGILQIRSVSNTSYTRTSDIYKSLQYRYYSVDKKAYSKWTYIQKENVESVTATADSVTVKVTAGLYNQKYTKELTLPIVETVRSVSQVLSSSVNKNYSVNGIVVGFTSTYMEREMLLADKTDGKLITVTKIGEGSVLHGGYDSKGIEVGDEVILPVKLVKVAQSTTSASSNKLHAEFTGGVLYETAVISKNNALPNISVDVEITDQEQLKDFLSSSNRSKNIYKTVKIKGELNFTLGTTHEVYYFWFSGESITSETRTKIDGMSPVFLNPAIYYSTGKSFGELVFDNPQASSFDYSDPLYCDVEIIAVYLGGNSSYNQFLILDESWVKLVEYN